jgi:hypothetical protein
LEAEFPLDARISPVEVSNNRGIGPFAQAREQHTKKKKRSMWILLGKVKAARV